MKAPTTHGGRCFILAALAVLLAPIAVGCRGCKDTSPKDEELVIFAAASLRDAFEALAAEFEAGHPGVDVTLGTAGSQALRVQIENGAPADVFASANPDHVDALASQDLVAERSVFARNRLVIIVPRENPAGLRTVADLPRAARIVIGAKTVPIGKYTRSFLDRAAERFDSRYRTAVEEHIVSEELNVRLVATKVSLGEADAGIAYATDARAFSDRIEAIDIPDDLNVIGEYHQAVLTSAPHPDLARAFVELVTSPRGGDILSNHGFDPVTLED